MAREIRTVEIVDNRPQAMKIEDDTPKLHSSDVRDLLSFEVVAADEETCKVFADVIANALDSSVPPEE